MTTASAPLIEPNKLQGIAPTGHPDIFPETRLAIIACKNHLDVGFTGTAAKVIHDQINWMFPTAIDQNRRLRDEGLSFCWTVGSWLVWEALERKSGAALTTLEQGIAEGAIAWLATPFTTHTELMDEELVEAALGLSRQLDARFGCRTVTGKMTDVPGHTRGLVPLLARAGVSYLHIGVNHMSTKPEVPDLFRWRDPESGAEVVVAYSRSYARDIHLPGHQTALLFRMIGDNMEVPSMADVRSWFANARTAHPQAAVRAGRLDDFFTTLDPLRESLPILEQEIGDTWIHGGGTDPWKIQRFRELLRLRKDWLRARRLLPESKSYVRFSNALALVAEHTWSISIGPHLHDTVNWANADFARVRHRGPFRLCEASWQEQRDYLEDAVEALDPALAAEARQALHALSPCRPDLSAWNEGTPADGPLRLDPQTGAVLAWSLPHGAVQAPDGLGLFRYQTLSKADLDQFRADYNGRLADEAAVDFGKPGLPPDLAESRWWTPHCRSFWHREGGKHLLARLDFPAQAHRDYGTPSEVWLEIQADPTARTIDWTLTWFDKTATRLPEAFWFSFAPALPEGMAWHLLKLGREIDPATVVSKGGRALHATWGARARHPNGTSWHFDTPDAPLIAPGRPSLAQFTNEVPDSRAGLHVCLFNNLWGTNFPQWNGDDLRFRFRLTMDS